MKFDSIKLEDPLPNRIEVLRRENDRKFHDSSLIDGSRPESEKLWKLIERGYGGIARNIIEMWLRTNESEVEFLEILLRSNDSSATPQQRISWAEDILEIEKDNEIALESLLLVNEDLKGHSDRTEIPDKLIKLYPNNPRGRKHQVEEFVEYGEFGRAVETCESILKNDPENEYALRQRPIIFTRMSRFEEAAYFWSEWLDFGKASIQDKFRAARAHYNSKHYSECISILMEILDQYPDKEAIIDLIIRSNYSLMNWRICNDWCEEILVLNSRNRTGLKYMRLTKARISSKLVVVASENQEEMNFSETERDFLMWFDYL